MYGFRSVNLTLTNTAVRQQAFGANPRRVILILGATSTAGIRIAYTGGSGADGIWLIQNAQLATPLTFKSFGPLMQYDIWLAQQVVASVDVVATEVFRIAEC